MTHFPNMRCLRAAATLSTMQNPSGGFGGGHGQLSHAASAYAAVLTMASCGDEECFKIVDRKALWVHLSSFLNTIRCIS